MCCRGSYAIRSYKYNYSYNANDLVIIADIYQVRFVKPTALRTAEDNAERSN